MKWSRKKIFAYLTVLVTILSLIPNIRIVANATAPSLIQQYSIQERINSADNGSAVTIPAGIYRESITINKTLKILGENKSTTVIQANATDVVKITANNVYFSGFTVRDGGNGTKLTASNCTITGNMFFNNSFGIVLSGAVNNTISENVLINDSRASIGSGIFLLDRSTKNVVIGNTIISSGEAVYVLNSDNNTITRNFMLNNSKTGTCLMKGATSADYNKIHSNVMVGNHFGIDIYGVNHNTIFNNTLKNNGEGFEIENSNNNTFYQNNILNSWKGMYLLGSRNNTFYQNNIIDNYIQISFDNSASAWDNGFEEGNYWSDYIGSDANRDGIGDTPHFLQLNNTDYYPLMKPYMEADANHDGIVNIKDASLIGVVWNTTKGTIGYNPHADLNMDNTINMADVKVIHKNWQKRFNPP